MEWRLINAGCVDVFDTGENPEAESEDIPKGSEEQGIPVCVLKLL